jgi:hypothetical protein
MAIGIGRGIGFGGGVDYGGIASKIATDHKTRVEADGGVVESEAVLKQVLTHLCSTYEIKNATEFAAKLPVTLDPAVFGYKVGAGALSTLGWGCAKLYSINSAGDRVQGTAGNQPLLLRHNDTDGNFVYFPHISGSSANPAINSFNNPGIAFTTATDTFTDITECYYTTRNSYTITKTTTR